VRFSAICNDLFSSVDPEFWPAAEALKNTKAAPAEIIGGRRWVKPSKKAKRAAGINTSDEESSNHDSDNQANTGSKRKVGKNKDNSAGKKKSKEAPKKSRPRKKKSALAAKMRIRTAWVRMMRMGEIKRMHTKSCG
jgi:hypothetical protein